MDEDKWSGWWFGVGRELNVVDTWVDKLLGGELGDGRLKGMIEWLFISLFFSLIGNKSCIYMEKERWTLEYIDHVKQVQRGKATKERNKKATVSLSLEEIPANLLNQSKALSLLLCTSKPKLTDYLGTTITTYNHIVPHFQTLFNFSPAMSKKCLV